MRTQSIDTSTEAERVQIALLREAPIWRKLDVLGVLKVQASTLDRAYLQRWATALNEADLG